jgi:integrase/recombinase XerD
MLSDYVLALNIPEDQPVFPIQRNRVFNIVKKYGKMTGVNIHPHTLRHSFAINMVRGGTDLRRVQLMLGHTSLSITQVYLQFNDNDLREAYEKVAF